MPVAAVTLAIDPNCPAVLDSFNSADCVIVTEKPTPSHSSCSHTTGLTIGVAIEGVCIIILVIVIVVLIVTHQKKMTSYRSVKE